MLQLLFYYILEWEILTSANADIAKMKRQKSIVFIVEWWMQCLWLQLKSRSAREASRQANFIGNWLTVSHTCLLYLPRKWVFFVPGVAERNEHAGWNESFIFLFLVLIRWNEEGRWGQDLLLLPQGFESLSSALPQARWCKLACVCA